MKKNHKNIANTKQIEERKVEQERNTKTQKEVR